MNDKIECIDIDDTVYLISRLEDIKDHINSGNYHMAKTKLMADINALNNQLRQDRTCFESGDSDE